MTARLRVLLILLGLVAIAAPMLVITKNLWMFPSDTPDPPETTPHRGNRFYVLPEVLVERISKLKAEGVLVCVPTSPGKPAEPFWIGYQQYLNFYLAGLPQLGAQPSDEDLGFALQERNLGIVPSLTKDQAIEIARTLGETRVLMGRVSRDAGGEQAVFELISVKTGLPEGSPVTVSGSRMNISHRLDYLVSTFADRLGIELTKGQKTSIQRIAADPATLELLGTLPDQMDTKGWRKRATVLDDLTKKDPVVLRSAANAMMSSNVEYSQMSAEDRLDRAVKDSAEFTPAVETMLSVETNTQMTRVSIGVSRYDEVWPGNLRILLAKCKIVSHAPKVGDKTRRRLIAMFPNTASAWEAACLSASVASATLRGGEPFACIERKRAERIRELYDKTVEYGEKALELNPRSIRVMTELQWVYMAEKRMDKSDQMFRRILSVDPSNSLAYCTAIQAREPEWNPDPAAQAAIAREAVTATAGDKCWESRGSLVDVLGDNGYDREAAQIMRAGLDRGLAPVVVGNLFLAGSLSKTWRIPEAQTCVRTAISTAEREGFEEYVPLFSIHVAEYQQHGEYLPAIMLYSAMFAHGHKPARDVSSRAYCYFEMGQYEKAALDWHRTKPNPNDFRDMDIGMEAKLGLAAIDFEMGRSQAAEKTCQSITAKHGPIGSDFLCQWLIDSPTGPRPTRLYRTLSKLLGVAPARQSRPMPDAQAKPNVPAYTLLRRA